MKKNIIFLFLNFFILTACNSLNNSNFSSNSKENNLSQTSEESSKSYQNYQKYIIELNDMFKQNDEFYAVYFYSEYCPACASLKELLFSFLDNQNKCVDNLYLVDIGNTSEEDFNKLKNTNGLYEEDIINNNLGVSNIENLYFRTSPCIYFIKKINNNNEIIDHYLLYQDVFDFLVSNSLKIN